MPATAVLPAKPGAAYASVRLRTAGVADAERLAALYHQVRPGTLGTVAGMRTWLTTGSVMFVEDDHGRVLAALAWRAERAGAIVSDAGLGNRPAGAPADPGAGDTAAGPTGRPQDVEWSEGWRVEPIATLPSHRGRGFGRWLMTHLEASAIRGNVPFLALTIDDPEVLPYYRRLGYRQVDEGGRNLCKRVGGTWQKQETTR